MKKRNTAGAETSKARAARMNGSARNAKAAMGSGIAAINAGRNVGN